MLSGGGLFDELAPRPGKSYRLWCVVVCDLETSRMRRPWPTGDCRAKNKQIHTEQRRAWDLLPYVVQESDLDAKSSNRLKSCLEHRSDIVRCFQIKILNPLNAELNPICHLLALLGAHHILHVSWVRVKYEYQVYG